MYCHPTDCNHLKLKTHFELKLVQNTNMIPPFCKESKLLTSEKTFKYLENYATKCDNALLQHHYLVGFDKKSKCKTMFSIESNSMYELCPNSFTVNNLYAICEIESDKNNNNSAGRLAVIVVASVILMGILCFVLIKAIQKYRNLFRYKMAADLELAFDVPEENIHIRKSPELVEEINESSCNIFRASQFLQIHSYNSIEIDVESQASEIELNKITEMACVVPNANERSNKEETSEVSTSPLISAECTNNDSKNISTSQSLNNAEIEFSYEASGTEEVESEEEARDLEIEDRKVASSNRFLADYEVLELLGEVSKSKVFIISSICKTILKMFKL